MSHEVEEKVIRLREWLAEEIETGVAVSRDDALTYWFIPEDNMAKPIASLRVSLSALEDKSVDDIVADLVSESTVELMVSEPTFWPLYMKDGKVDHCERRHIDLDGERYLVPKQA